MQQSIIINENVLILNHSCIKFFKNKRIYQNSHAQKVHFGSSVMHYHQWQSWFSKSVWVKLKLSKWICAHLIRSHSKWQLCLKLTTRHSQCHSLLCSFVCLSKFCKWIAVSKMSLSTVMYTVFCYTKSGQVAQSCISHV